MPPKHLNTTIHTPQSFRDLLQQERARVHRKGQPFSLILFRLADQENLQGVVQTQILPAILKRIRKIDHVGLYDHHHIGLLLPLTGSDGARRIADDLYRAQPVATNVKECEFFLYP